eukprot:CAMPEP_0206301406 /NCGR_PEP_ID=MMETSP0106_2-20121207/8194_1 /ASSEMBLY_ACC=CAM_ASM_000206 /TAXON_ID=81532 /ORGANISM="Acanthoeca-like sp., Strain 10tr" /LENGTH=185 /DNA_ID=CAMNT_0053732147 /DNA_START=125 /DNA_END=679 /DNA_ORIENTATION=+
MWNRWWAATRRFSPVGQEKNASVGLLAPGSTRENLDLVINCNSESAVGASRCETGLDNSPLYDGAQFVDDEDVIDSVDVGMSALYARDCFVLANISGRLGRSDLADELTARGTSLISSLNDMGWNGDYGIYVNRRWHGSDAWFPTDSVTGVLVVGPPNLYPLLAKAPSNEQVTCMIERFLANASE